MKKLLVIQNIRDLKKISREINILGVKKYELNVAFNFLTEYENKAIESEVRKYYSVCGCGEGKAAGVVTLLIFIVLLLTGLVSVSTLGIFKTVSIYFIIAFVTMFISKMYSIINARWKLSRLVKEVESKHINY